MRRSEFLTWSLFYKTVLGLPAEAAGGDRRSARRVLQRSLRSANGALRIPLNISDGGATGVSRFLDAFGGAGFQQIALATDDIFAAVERARWRTASPSCRYPTIITTISAARFDIAPDLLARMRGARRAL